MYKDPKVSVILTTYYREGPLRRAIEHIFSQSYDNIELFVVDDSGEEFSKSIVREYDDINYLPHNTNQGQIAAWNTGMSCTSGKYIQFHDDDDWLHPDKISKQVDFLESHPDIGSVYCGISDQNGTQKLPPKTNRGNVLIPTLLHDFKRCQTTTMLSRRKLLKNIFPLRIYPAATDIVLQLELSPTTKFDYINEALVHRDLSTNGVGSSITNRETRLKLIDDYEHMYENHPQIKKRALSNSYSLLGKTLIENNQWSLRAILAFLKANYHHPEISINLISYLIASLFGNAGIQARNQFVNTLKSNNISDN